MNTTETLRGGHEHNFGAYGKCSCGLTFDEFRLQQEAANAPKQAEAVPEPEPVEQGPQGEKNPEPTTE